MKFVIAQSNLPMQPKLGSLAIIYLLLENFGAPTWVYFAFGVFAVFAVAGWYIDWQHRVEVDLFEKAGEVK